MIKHSAEAKCIKGEKLLFEDIFLVLFLRKGLKAVLTDDKFIEHGEIQTGGF